MSKLSHLAVVLPNLDKTRLKLIEKLFFTFLWGNKSEKVCRADCKLSEKAGGLGLVDIKAFWTSLKFSWLRRVLHTAVFWPKILEYYVESVLGYRIPIIEILQLGPNQLKFIGNKIQCRFWKEIFISVNSFMQGALFCFPENLVISPFWENPSITRNNKVLKNSTFPNISSKIKTISDFFHPGSDVRLTRDELEQKYEVTISNETFYELHHIINIAR